MSNFEQRTKAPIVTPPAEAGSGPVLPAAGETVISCGVRIRAVSVDGAEPFYVIFNA